MPDFEKTKIKEIIPIYNRIEIYGYGKINSLKSNLKEIKINYEVQNDCNIIDLINEKIELYKSLEIELTQ